MKLDIRYSNNPEDVRYYTTDDLRRHFFIESVFEEDIINLVYSHNDRIIAGGVMPITKPLVLQAGKELGVSFFLERRELGIINIGGPGEIILDDKKYDLIKGDGMYVGMGTKHVEFRSLDGAKPAKFYINSAPAHTTYPTVKIELAKANPNKLGDPKNLNVRTIYQYLHPAVCKTCQLLMGMTVLEEGSVWNTMPCHTHDRRMEVYFYFDMAPTTRVFHLHGEPSETRHFVVANEQAIISPSWSIHSGVGTGAYTFIWGMCGENQTFTDMDVVAMEDLK